MCIPLGLFRRLFFFYWFAPYENVFVVFIVCDFFYMYRVLDAFKGYQ